MNQRTIEAKQIADFGRMLREEERRRNGCWKRATARGP